MKQTLMKNGIWMLIFFLISCGKDDPKPSLPTLSATSEQVVDGVFKGTYYSGAGNKKYATLSLKIQGTVPQGFQKLVISKNTGGTSKILKTLTGKDVTLTGTSFSYDYQYEVEAGDVGKEIQLDAEVVDLKTGTTSVSMASVNVLHSAKLFELEMDSDNLHNDVANNQYYLEIDPIFPEGVSSASAAVTVMLRDELAIKKTYETIHVIFDYSHALAPGGATGPYLASPKAMAIANSKLTEGFSFKNTTLLRISEYNALSPSDVQKLNDISINNVHHLAEVFEKLSPESNPELVYLNKTSKYFVMFKMKDGRIGYMNEIAFNLEKKRIDFDLWVSSN